MGLRRASSSLRPRIASPGRTIASQIAEDLLAGREWFLDHYTLPDAFFFWCFRRAMKFEVDLAEFTNCRAHFERVSQRASTQKLLEFEARTLAELQETK